MLELFAVYKSLEAYSNIDSLNRGFDVEYLPSKIPISWIIIALLISFGTAYIAYACNQYEKPATRALSTIIAFFFSGFYLIYYFIFHVLFDRKCGSRGINNIVMNVVKK
jgi:magnesium-transporting ATPase (P-type)